MISATSAANTSVTVTSGYTSAHAALSRWSSAIPEGGMAMGRRSLLTEVLGDECLMAPFPGSLSGDNLDLICPTGEEKRPHITAVTRWLAAQGVAVDETQAAA